MIQIIVTMPDGTETEFRTRDIMLVSLLETAFPQAVIKVIELWINTSLNTITSQKNTMF